MMMTLAATTALLDMRQCLGNGVRELQSRGFDFRVAVGFMNRAGVEFWIEKAAIRERRILQFHSLAKLRLNMIALRMLVCWGFSGFVFVIESLATDDRSDINIPRQALSPIRYQDSRLMASESGSTSHIWRAIQRAAEPEPRLQSTSYAGRSTSPRPALISWTERPWVRMHSEPGLGQTWYAIPAFEHPLSSGQIWGPYKIGANLFEPKPYPIQIPVFEHLYRNTQFVNIHPSQLLSIRQTITGASDMIFFPEPQRLWEIQIFLWNKLHAQGISPGLVYPQNSLYHLQWIWPPTILLEYSNRLQLPESLLRVRIRRGLESRLVSHLLPDPNLYQLAVPTSEGGERHYLMVPTQNRFHVDMPHSLTSKFWMFYEGVSAQGSTRPKVAFLGGLFLPASAERALSASGSIKPAFEDVLHSHDL